MSLPCEYVEAIFTKMSLVYGRTFLDRWAGMDMQSVKADWAHELSALETSPKSIAYALQNLPAEKPPTVLEFRKIAWAMPAADMPEIAYTPASRKVIAAAMNALSKPTESQDERGWARRIMSRFDAGDKISPYSLSCAKSALRLI